MSIGYTIQGEVTGNLTNGAFGRSAINPDHNALVVGGMYDDPDQKGRVVVYELDTSNVPLTINQRGNTIYGVANGECLGIRVDISGDGNRLFLASRNCRTYVYDWDIGGLDWVHVFTTPNIGVNITSDYYALTLKANYDGNFFMVTNPDPNTDDGIIYFYKYDPDPEIEWEYRPDLEIGGANGSNSARWICSTDQDFSIIVTCSNILGKDVEIYEYDGSSFILNSTIPIAANQSAQMVGINNDREIISIFIKQTSGEGKIDIYDYDGSNWNIRNGSLIFSNVANGLSRINFSYDNFMSFIVDSTDSSDPSGIYEWASSMSPEMWISNVKYRPTVAEDTSGAVVVPTGYCYSDDGIISVVSYSVTDPDTFNTTYGAKIYVSGPPLVSEAVDDFTPNRYVINNVTGGDTPSILINDNQQNPEYDIIIIDSDGGIDDVVVNDDGNALNIPSDVPVGNYDLSYHLENLYTSATSNTANIYLRIVSTQPPGETYPINELDLVQYTITNTSSNDGNIFVNPVADTSDPSVYESMILNGYTGNYASQIMSIARLLYSPLHRAALVTNSTITNNLDGTNQTTVNLTIAGINIAIVY
jgi:hypothetical protein